MAEIAQDRAAKATEIAVRALEQERKCRIALILSWFFLVMLFSCFGSNENVGMMRLSLPNEL